MLTVEALRSLYVALGGEAADGLDPVPGVVLGGHLLIEFLVFVLAPLAVALGLIKIFEYELSCRLSALFAQPLVRACLCGKRRGFDRAMGDCRDGRPLISFHGCLLCDVFVQ